MIDRSPVYDAPHVHEGAATTRIMWTVVLALAPAGIWGIWIYGWRALLLLAVSVGAALFGELAGNVITRRFTISDGSAVLSGLLIAYALPVGVPLYIPIAAALFAMLVIKASFGGLGTNWMNPAVGGQVFAYFSWSAAVTTWSVPRLWPNLASGISTSAFSPLQFAAAQPAGAGGGIGQIGPNLLHSYPVTAFAKTVSDWAAHATRVTIDPHYVDMFFGSVPGDLGGASVLLLLAGSIYLFRRRIITWEAPTAFLVSFILLVWVFGGLPHDRGWFAGAPVLHLFSGATVLAALYLVNDPVTTPVGGKGMIVFGLGVGFFAFLIRVFGAAEESVFMAILLMNVAVPAINRFTERRLNGTSRS